MIYGTTKGKSKALADVSNIQSINGKTGEGCKKELILTSRDIPYKDSNVEEALDKFTNNVVLPDYKNIENVNRFESSTSWIADRNGYVLVKISGLGSFELLIDDVPVINKVINDLDPDTELNLSQIFMISKDSEVRITVLESMIYSCQFIPLKVLII